MARSHSEMKRSGIELGSEQYVKIINRDTREGCLRVRRTDGKEKLMKKRLVLMMALSMVRLFRAVQWLRRAQRQQQRQSAKQLRLRPRKLPQVETDVRVRAL